MTEPDLTDRTENFLGMLNNQAQSLHNLNMKNGISFTPLNCALKALILALKNSAKAFVYLLMK